MHFQNTSQGDRKFKHEMRPLAKSYVGTLTALSQKVTLVVIEHYGCGWHHEKVTSLIKIPLRIETISHRIL